MLKFGNQPFGVFIVNKNPPGKPEGLQSIAMKNKCLAQALPVTNYLTFFS